MTAHVVSEERVDRLVQAMPGRAAVRTRARRPGSSRPGLPRPAAKLVADSSNRRARYAPSTPTKLGWRPALNNEIRCELAHATAANALRYELELRAETVADELKLHRRPAAESATRRVLTTPGGLRRPPVAGG